MKPLIAIVALGAAVSSACGGGEHAAEQKTSPPIAVTVARVSAIDTTDHLDAGGLVEADESATLSSRIVATVDAVRVKAGDRVRAGDVLIVLDARDVSESAQQARAGAIAAENALTQARADQAAADAEHRLATSWQRRIATLHARNSATDQERDEAEARLAAATARVSAAAAGVEGAGARLTAARAAAGAAAATESFATIRSPFNGVVTERLVDAGTLAAPGVPLLRVESSGGRQIVVRVDEARAAYVRIGDRVRVILDSPGDSDADDSQLEGEVREIARAIAADQRAFTVKVAVAGSLAARSGTFARVIFAGAPRRALLIPPVAIHRKGQVEAVYVVQDGVARLRLIHSGAASSSGVEVLAGLDAGESIVISSQTLLTDGAAVTVGAGGAS